MVLSVNGSARKCAGKERQMSKEWTTLQLYEQEHLLIDAEAVLYAPKVSEYGNVYGVEGAGLADLPALETIEISDTDTVADVSVKLNEMLYDLDMNGCKVGEALEIAEDFDVVYSPLWQIFLLVSDMNTSPVYPYWDKDKEDFNCIWLNEPEHIIDVPDEAGITLSDEFGHTEVYEIYQLDSKPVYDRLLLRYITQENQPAGLIISSKELDTLLQNAQKRIRKGR